MDPKSKVAFHSAASVASAAVEQAFLQPVRPGAGVARVGPLDSPQQFPALDGLLLPSRLSTIFEGIVIEKCVGHALQSGDRYFWIGKRIVDVTEHDRALAERNAHADLAAIEPPAAGQPIGRVELDGLAVDLRTGVLIPCDIKRSPSAGDRDRARFVATLLAAKRALRNEGVQFAGITPLRLRWFAAPTNLARGFACRETVDAALDAPVREVVDHAVGVYRNEFERRLRALLATAHRDPHPPAPPTVSTPAPRRAACAVDVDAIQRVFGRARFGRTGS